MAQDASLKHPAEALEAWLRPPGSSARVEVILTATSVHVRLVALNQAAMPPIARGEGADLREAILAALTDGGKR